MTTTAITERQARLRDIAENPREDLPRLAFADWLQDHGEDQYAEFIRVQCELANTKSCVSHSTWISCVYKPECDYCRLKQRSQSLLGFGPGGSIPLEKVNWHKWAGSARETVPRTGLHGYVLTMFHRGLISHVRCTFEEWGGGYCGCDNGSIDTGGTTPWGEPISDKCPHCHGTGRTLGIGAKLIGEELQPVVSVEITDGVRVISWLPNDVPLTWAWDDPTGQIKAFDSKSEADLALSISLINVERRRIGLRDLTLEDCQ